MGTAGRRGTRRPATCYFFLPLGVCESADPAAVFDLAPVRPSRRTDDAAFAALGLVSLVRYPCCPL